MRVGKKDDDAEEAKAKAEKEACGVLLLLLLGGDDGDKVMTAWLQNKESRTRTRSSDIGRPCSCGRNVICCVCVQL